MGVNAQKRRIDLIDFARITQISDKFATKINSQTVKLDNFSTLIYFNELAVDSMASIGNELHGFQQYEKVTLMVAILKLITEASVIG